MRSTSILGVSAVVILALLVLLWVVLDSGGEIEISADDARERPGQASVAREDSAAHAAASAGAQASAQRAEVERPATAVEPTCLVRVVLAASKAPVPDARVWLQREDADQKSAAWTKLMRRFNDVEPVLQDGFGQELVLDERAETRVPRPTRELSLVAARGELHGEATLGPGDSECIVELQAYHSLACEVVDRSGRPVEGALVALTWGEFDPLEEGWTWITGADGRVWIPKLEEQISPDGYRGQVRLSLAAGVPGEPEIVLFTMDSVPTEPVRLVAGDCARLVVQLTDPQGTELALAGYANVEIGSSSGESLAARGGAHLHLPLDSGRARFECVGLGLPLEISASTPGHQNVWREVPGPTVAGEELRVLIPIGERRPNARGRVHGVRAAFADRKPRGARLDGRVPPAGVSFSSWVLENETFESPIWNASQLEKLEVPWTLELSHDGGPSLHAVIVPALVEDGSVLDFGDVVFDAEPVLARMRVTDDSGAAVEGADIEVWSGGNSRTLTCDDGGRYVLAGQTTELPLNVQASRYDWLASEPRRIEAPDSELTLVLRRAATLAGHLLLPPACSVDDLGLILRMEPNALVPEGTSYPGEIVDGGRFRFQGCAPGRGSLTVFFGNDAALERGGIELRPGETTELEPIDLSGTLHLFELSFELAGGEPWTRGHLELCEADGELSSTWATIGSAGRARFFALSPSVALWAAGRGARPVRFESVLDGDHLTLPSAPSIVLRLADGLRRPEPPLALMVGAVRVLPEEVAFEPDDPDTEDCIVGADGTARLRVPWPGDYRLVWFVRHTGTGVDFAIQQAEPQTIHVAESSASVSVEAALTRAEVAEAVLAAGG